MKIVALLKPCKVNLDFFRRARIHSIYYFTLEKRKIPNTCISPLLEIRPFLLKVGKTLLLPAAYGEVCTERFTWRDKDVD